MNTLTTMSAREILLISTLADLAREAENAAHLIETHYSNAFGIGRKEIEVYRTESCGEYYGYGYLNVDAVFRYTDNWGGDREYQFTCDAEGIYSMLRSCYLRENEMAHLDPEHFNCPIDHIDRYFREFVESLSGDENQADAKNPAW